MSTSTNSIIEKIDELLEDDRNFTTRTGLRFMTTVMREALQVIGDVSKTSNRLTDMENKFSEFLTLQKNRREKDESERNKWRWAFIAPLIVIVLNELARWLTGTR